MTAVFQVGHDEKWRSCLLDSDGKLVESGIQYLADCFDKNYRMCQGISLEEYEKISVNIHINIKNKEVRFCPFKRIVHSKCPLWFKVARGTKKDEKENHPRCSDCKYLTRYIKNMDDRNSSTSSAELAERLKPSSHFPINKLTPHSQAKRTRQSGRKREELNKKLQKMEEKIENYDITLYEEQNQEMEKIVDWISKNQVNTLETIFTESIDLDTEMPDYLREIWMKDTEDRKNFYKDQLENGEYVA